jgi:hypothetical protein
MLYGYFGEVNTHSLLQQIPVPSLPQLALPAGSHSTEVILLWVGKLVSQLRKEQKCKKLEKFRRYY